MKIEKGNIELSYKIEQMNSQRRGANCLPPFGYKLRKY